MVKLTKWLKKWWLLYPFIGKWTAFIQRFLTSGPSQPFIILPYNIHQFIHTATAVSTM